MMNGLGEYFAEGSVPSASLPDQMASMPAPPAAPAPMPSSGVGEYFSQNGLSAVNLGPPRGSGSVTRFVRKHSPVLGALGDASDTIQDAKTGVITGVAAATTFTTIVIGLGLRFGAGWLVGKQLAPNRADEQKYKWGAALSSVALGTLGLGITAVVADHAKR